MTSKKENLVQGLIASAIVVVVACVVVIHESGEHQYSPIQAANERSIGWLPEGECMSSAKLDRAVSKTDWTQVEGSATFRSDQKALIGAVAVFDEMKRLGTQPCPDLRPLFERYSGL